jgi:diguanylate cyclase (GGDEF)-like protein
MTTLKVKGTPMDDFVSRPSGGVRHEQSTVNARTDRNRKLRGGYLVASFILIALYALLPTTGRNIVFLLASLGAIPTVLVGLRRISPSYRRTWVLLLAALAVINIANVIAVFPGNPAPALSSLLDATGNLVVLAAAVTLVMQQGRNNLGSIIDTTIAAVALGGLLWDVVLAPNLLTEYRAAPTTLALCVVVFALSGVIGALAQLVIMRNDAALRPLITAVALALVANIIVAVTTDPRLNTAAGMMFIGVGFFGLDPTASQLVTPVPVRPDRLSHGRLVFLGLAVAIVPIVIGVRQLAGGSRDGLVLVISSATIATLVMVRIGQLSAQRDQAEGALRHEATHDALTGLPNRKEFLRRLGGELSRGHRCAIIFSDLDRFKEVNDRFGHAEGDLVLVEVARRLRNCVRAGDLVSRFGGDEFVILISDATPDEVQAINRRIIEELSRPVSVSGELVTIGVTTGTAFAADGVDPEELIMQADLAMYAAKSSGTVGPAEADSSGALVP